MKKLIFIVFLAIAMLLCISCAENKYRTDVTPEELANRVKNALPLPEGYASHGEDYIDFRFEGIEEHIESYAIIYSRDTRYADLFAIFKAKSESDAKKAADICESFINDQRELFSGIVERYLPSEKEKLDGATVKTLGSYVAVCVLSPSDAEKALSEIENALK